jgi:hypothetical protein
MADWVYYPQNSLTRAATITEIDGTLGDDYNQLNSRQHSVTRVSSVSSDDNRFSIDLGSGNTLAADFVALVNNNLYTVNPGGGTYSLYTGSTDNGTTWDQPVISGSTIQSTHEPILLKTFTTMVATGAKRYFRFELQNTTTSAYWGCLLLGVKSAPTHTVNYGESIEYDRSGVKMNRTTGGNKLGVKNYKRVQTWGVRYELIPTADKTTIIALENNCDGPLWPFVFADTDGNLFYARFNSNVATSETNAGLWDVRFMLEEEA